MTLSRLCAECAKCPKVDTCDHKRIAKMELEHYMNWIDEVSE